LNWSIRLGRLAGIDVFMHWTFLLLVGYFGLMSFQAGLAATQSIQHGLFAALLGMTLILAVFGCVVLHELGHALTARRYGIRTRDITLLPIGGVARLERMPEEPSQELWVALAGPAVNVVIALMLTGVLYALGHTPSVSDDELIPTSSLSSLVALLAFFLTALRSINIFLVLFNLLPAFPMDGGRVLRATLARWLEYGRATLIAARIGQIMALLFVVAGLFGIPWIGRDPQPMLVLVALFVYVGAEGELRMVQRRLALAGATVRDAMLTSPLTIPPNATLIQVADNLMIGPQRDFPVVLEDKLLGMLRRDQLIAALHHGREHTSVAENLAGDGLAVEETEMLDRAQERMNEHGVASLPVTSEGRFSGLLTRESIETMLTRRALAEGKSREVER
jgi:Zn-dependent protease/CBS domain-containing protein